MLSVSGYSKVSVDIRSSPTTVWSLIRDLDKAVLTDPQLVEVHHDESTPFGIGERRIYTYEFLGRRIGMSWETTDLTEGRRLSVRSENGFTRTFDLEYSEPLGTTVTMTAGGTVSLGDPGLKGPGTVLTTTAVSFLTRMRRVAESGALGGVGPSPEVVGASPRPPTLLDQSSRNLEWWWKMALLLGAYFVALTLMMLAIMFGVTALGRSDHSIATQETKAILVLAPLFGALIAPTMLISGLSIRRMGWSLQLTRQHQRSKLTRATPTSTDRRAGL